MSKRKSSKAAPAAKPAEAAPTSPRAKAAPAVDVHDPNCPCHTVRFKSRFEIEALVSSEAEADALCAMFAKLGAIVQATGTPVRMHGEVFAREDRKQEEPAPDATRPRDLSVN